MKYNSEIINVYNLIAREYFIKRESMALVDEIKKLCSLVPLGGQILDAGCGNGRDAVLFAQNGFNVVGVDLSEGQLQFAYRREKSPQLTFLKQDILHLNFPKEYFNGIWCCAVLSHLKKEDVLEVLFSFKRILANPGYVIATFKKGMGESYVVEPEFNGIKRFTTFFNEDDIYSFAESSGFVITKMYTYNERERFTKDNRDLDFIVTIMKKKFE